MDEQMKRELNDMIVNAVGGMRETENALRAEIEQLKNELSEKETAIGELNQKLAEAEQNTAAKEQEVQEAKTAQANSDSALNEVQGKYNQLISDGIVAQLNSAVSEFTETQVSAAKEEIEAFKADPIAHQNEINSIVNKIEAAAYREMKETQRKQAELNSKKPQKLFAYVDEADQRKDINDADDLSKIFG